MIKDALFYDLGNVAYGAAIYCSGKDLTLICCRFDLNYVTTEGGSIHFTNGVLNISKTSFLKCYSSKHTNTVEGNAIRVNGKLSPCVKYRLVCVE